MPHEIQCETCGQTFSAVRYDARYCSDLCRANANRQKRIQQETEEAVLVHEVIDIHDRSTRLYLRVRPGRHDQIDIQFTRTFSGSSKPDQHRVVWQTSLPPESAKLISDIIAAAIAGEPS